MSGNKPLDDEYPGHPTLSKYLFYSSTHDYLCISFVSCVILYGKLKLKNLVVGRFHVKGPRKKVNVKKWIFFNEMLKIIGQIDDFHRFFNNSCNLGVFLAKNKKYQKMTVLKK